MTRLDTQPEELQSLRVVLAVHHFPPNRTAGAELRAYRLARWLVRAGHRVQVVCIESIDDSLQGRGLGSTDGYYDGIPVRRLAFDGRASPDPIALSYSNPLIEKHFQSLLDGFRPDLLHLVSGYLMGAGPLRAARQANIPAVVTLTDFWFLCPTIQLLRGDGTLCWAPEAAECTRCWLNLWRPFHWLEGHAPPLTRPVSAWLRMGLFVPGSLRQKVRCFSDRQRSLRHALNQAQALICVTQFVADLHISNGIDPDLFHVIPYLPADPLATMPVTETVRWNAPVHFAYLGAVSPHKGVEDLIRAFRRLESPTPARLTIYGFGNPPAYRDKLKVRASGHPRIEFAGRYDCQSLPRILSGVDVVIVPSQWHENAPRTIIEAFQHGKPVIGANVGGIAALVEHGENGLLFERGSPASLARQMQRVLDDPDVLDVWGANIPELAIGDVENERVYSVYRQVLGGNGGIA